MEDLIEDAWAYAFAMSPGTKLRNEKIKEKFIVFAKERLVSKQSTQEEIINLIPSFINYLGEW